MATSDRNKKKRLSLSHSSATDDNTGVGETPSGVQVNQLRLKPIFLSCKAVD
ncbi:hypothetical protein ACSBR1_035651 [Camellia fascicularis]